MLSKQIIVTVLNLDILFLQKASYLDNYVGCPVAFYANLKQNDKKY